LIRSHFETVAQNGVLEKSFFLPVSLEEEIPDHTTICRFRNLLAEKKLLQKLPNEVNAQLAAQGKVEAAFLLATLAFNLKKAVSLSPT